MRGMTQRKVLLGHIAGPHGVKGDVLINTYTGVPESIAEYGPLSDETGQRSFVVSVRRATAKGVVACIEGVADRTTAEALKGVRLYVDRDRLPGTAENEFYHADLIGLAVVTADGSTVGKVKAVQNFGAGDLIEVVRPGSRHTELIPFTERFVDEVDIAAGRIVVRLPE
jgi:16S rRNA processing protein RimM